jgi:hypothetical protein
VRLLSFYWERRAAGPVIAADDGNAAARAERATRLAAIECALTGATAGLTSTGAAAITTETEGVGGIVALPVAALTIGGEMALRTLIHIDLICKMADIFGVEVGRERPDDVWRLYALLFGAADHDEHSTDPGKKLVAQLIDIEKDKLGDEIGMRVLGESVMRNVVPVAAVGVSAFVNWRRTQRIGDIARRYMRYWRAISGAFERMAREVGREDHELLIEGVWFVFIADGRLGYEESTALANLVKRLPESARDRVLARFVEDEGDWLDRVEAEVKGDARAPFLRALEVAAAVDKIVGSPERRLLRSAARRLEIPYDPKRAEAMVEELDATGVLSSSV